MSVLERFHIRERFVLERNGRGIHTSFQVFGRVSQAFPTIKGAILKQRLHRHVASCRLIRLHQGRKTFVSFSMFGARELAIRTSEPFKSVTPCISMCLCLTKGHSKVLKKARECSERVKHDKLEGTWRLHISANELRKWAIPAID